MKNVGLFYVQSLFQGLRGAANFILIGLVYLLIHPALMDDLAGKLSEFWEELGMYKQYSIVLGAALAVGVAGMAGGAMAKVEGDTIILGSALSLTGKYSTNGFHTQKGYDFAVDRINSMGGVKVGGKSYKLAITYYDDESTPSRASQLTERLIQQDGVEFMLGPYSTTMTKAVAPVTEKFSANG